MEVMPTHISMPTPDWAQGWKESPNNGRELDAVCHCKVPAITPEGECVQCHRPRTQKIAIFEMSEDGGNTWERLSRLPFNSKPFHQCMLFGEYQEGDTFYRRILEDA